MQALPGEDRIVQHEMLKEGDLGLHLHAASIFLSRDAWGDGKKGEGKVSCKVTLICFNRACP